MSSYLPISFSSSIDNEDTPLAISSHSKRSSSSSQLPPGSPSRLRATNGANKFSRIGESGMEALAVAIKGNIRLSQLMLVIEYKYTIHTVI